MAYQFDRKYLALRMDEELERGDQASNSSIAAIHYELAYRYAIKCREEPSAPLALRLIPGGQQSASNAELQSSAQIASQPERRPLDAIKAQA